MKTIPQELVTFKTNVEPQMGNMTATYTSLTDKLSQIVTANDTTKNGVDSYYNSSNKDSILNKFSSLNNVINKINTSLSSDLQKMLSDSQTLIGKVSELESINNEISEQESIISRYSGSTDESEQSMASAAESVKRQKEAEFDTKCSEAKTLLSNLQSMDTELSFVQQFMPSDYSEMKAKLTGGTFERRYYKASNGIRVQYYIFVPDYGGETVQGLPVHLYLHGAGESGDGVLNQALPRMLQKKEITPNGIVICPQAGTENNTFYQKSFQDAIIELTQSVVQEYNADPNRVSMSGHSMGAIAGYQILSRYPGVFSAFVPISGRNTEGNNIQNMADVKVWAFHGKLDESVQFYKCSDVVNSLNAAGGDAYIHVFEDRGHAEVQNLTFRQEYLDSEGEMINPLDWAFQQTRATA